MLAQATVNGILLGGLYGLATVGFSMVWGVMGVINLAHTSFITLGAYVTYVLFQQFGIDPLVAMPVSMLLMFVLGYGIQRLILNRIIRTSLLLSLVVTFGIDLVLTDATVITFTSDVRSVNASYATTSVTLFGVLVPLVRLIAAALSLAIGVAFFVFLRRASLGQAILATALDREISN